MNRFVPLLVAVVVCAAGSVWAGEPSAPTIRGPLKLQQGVPLAVSAARLSRPLLTIARPGHGSLTLKLDQTALVELKAAQGPVLIESVPLRIDRAVDLEVERFRVTLPTTQFVIGRADGVGMPFDFDPESIVLLRGRIAGDLNSHVYLALSERGSNGLIESQLGRFGVSSSGGDPVDAPLAAGEVAIYPALAAGPNPTPLCQMLGEAQPDTPGPDGAPIPSLRQIELAIETDYEFFQVLQDETSAAAYVVQLYGAVSDIFMRNLNTRIDLTFVRIWNTPTEPFNASLNNFVNYWNANMQAVHRDVAQMFSGRGDLPGGVAYVDALCGNFAYSFCGNVAGHFGGVDQSSVYNHDLSVAAHELGHNCGSLHTDAYDLDICNQSNTPPQRGTIMSYCSQTVSGGASVTDMSFHKVTQDAMKEDTYTSVCVDFDCNQNGTPDWSDLALGLSVDSNFNGIPDECEDCNSNGTLDPADIALGVSQDVNANGLPDECEPDCNNNGVPDTFEIQAGTSTDMHGNNIPDECETDCNANSVSDYSEIMDNMTLDKNRNVILDSCEDCDNDGIVDTVELDGAWNAWAASSSQNLIRQHHAVTGVLMGTSDAGFVSQASDLIVLPGRRVIVSSTGSNKVVEFDDQGNYVRDLVMAGAGGLSSPAGMVLSPGGSLLVASTANHRVLEYNPVTGAFNQAFIAPGSGGLTQPLALAYGPDGHLYVSGASNQIFKYNSTTGAFISIFVTAAGNGGLSSPRGMVFKPDGNLLVTSFANDSIREYNGVTGAYVKNWAIVGVAFDGPSCIRIAPNGNVHVSSSFITDSHLTKADISEFNILTGTWVRGYVMGADAGLTSATGFDYLPGDATDCNRNNVPDNCDIAGGFSADLNNNGIPDECEGPPCVADITGDDTVNIDDLLAVINNWGAGAGNVADINNDGTVNIDDLLAVINAWGSCP